MATASLAGGPATITVEAPMQRDVAMAIKDWVPQPRMRIESPGLRLAFESPKLGSSKGRNQHVGSMAWLDSTGKQVAMWRTPD